MPPSTVQTPRIQKLNGLPDAKGRYVLYWMQQAQRADCNHALEFAVQQANRLNQGVLVGFGLTDRYPEANLRHFTFMLEGLRETQENMAKKDIKMVLLHGSPDEVALSLGKKASLIVCDRGYLRHQKRWRRNVAGKANCGVIQVETDVVVPVEAVSRKAEYAARTIRPKLHRLLDDYLIPFKSSAVKKSSLGLKLKGLNIRNPQIALKKLSLDRGVPPVTRFFKGGAGQAESHFDEFIEKRFSNYVKHRNQPQTDDVSRMSPYLHFGQVSPLHLALKIIALPDRLKDAKESYLEELIVRRELAANFAHHTRHYDGFDCLPAWAKTTLKEHRTDRREFIYSKKQLEAARTHDEYWNAAMREMKLTGYMHNHMRMYWGKKILEWSRTPEHAFRTALALNNKYFLDGRDPNSYAGVAWVFGLHDRAWFQRPIFGKVRYMAASGLERKCDIRAYVKKIDALAEDEKMPSDN